MPNELRVRVNGIGGKVEDNPLTDAATVLTSAGLAAVPVIGTTQHLAVVLDPDGIDGAPEIVWVTAHAAAATTATILRGQEGTTARQHLRDTDWVHGATVQDIDKPGVRAYRSTAQSIPNVAWTAIVFDNERWDDNGMWAAGTPTRLVCQRAGRYLVGAQAIFAGNATGLRYARFRHQASAVEFASDSQSGTTAGNTMKMLGLYQFAVGDYTELEVYQSSGAALNIDSGAAYSPEAWMQLVETVKV